MLELVEANPYTIRAYRRAAETIRSAPLPVADLVRSKRVRELRGIGQGIEARLRELVETGQIAELAELERELSPDLVGLGRYLGLGAKRSVELARSLGVRTADELREAAAAGRLRDVPGIGAKTEALLLEALAREQDARPRQGLLLNRARSWSAPSPPRSAASRRATSGGGATRASGSRSYAPRPTPRRCSTASPGCRRSWRCSSGASGARSGSRSRACRSSSSPPSPTGSGPRWSGRRVRGRTSRRSSRCRTRPTSSRCTRRSAIP